MVSKDIKFCLNVSLITVMAVCLLGCGVIDSKSAPPFQYYRSTGLDNASIKRAVIVPFTFVDGPEKIMKDVTQAFAIELRNTGLFQVITPMEEPKGLIAAGNEMWERGVINAKILMAARKKYGVDGFIFGKITDYKPYPPLTLGVRIMIISGITGKTLWSTDGVFDSDQREIVQLAKKYYKHYYKKDQSLYGWELMLVSMERYIRFIANMVVSTAVNAKT